MFIRKAVLRRIANHYAENPERKDYAYEDLSLHPDRRCLYPGDSVLVGYEDGSTQEEAQARVTQALKRAAANRIAMTVTSIAHPVYTLQYIAPYHCLIHFGIVLPSPRPIGCKVNDQLRRFDALACADVGDSFFYPYYAIWDQPMQSLLGGMHTMARYYGGLKIANRILPDGLLVFCIRRAAASVHPITVFHMENGTRIVFNKHASKRPDLKVPFLYNPTA